MGIPDEVLGQKLILVIEADENEILRSQVLDVKYGKPFHKPKEIVFVSKIPRTPNGKVKPRGTSETYNEIVFYLCF